MSVPLKFVGSGSLPIVGQPARSLGAHAAHPQHDIHGKEVNAALGPDEKALARERIVDVLWAIQQKHGWIDDASLAQAAAECMLTPAEADEVATFYNLLFRRPVGKRVVFVCDSISCELTGGAAVMDHLCAELGVQPGEVSKDGEWTILPIVCLGHCEKAPCVLAGETVHGPISTGRDAAKALVEKIRAGARGSASR